MAVTCRSKPLAKMGGSRAGWPKWEGRGPGAKPLWCIICGDGGSCMAGWRTQAPRHGAEAVRVRWLNFQHHQQNSFIDSSVRKATTPPHSSILAL
jgi:hypothetical protein